MRIILREDVLNLGKSGEVVSVKDGFGRNYLLPQGLAVLATERNVHQIEHHKKIIAVRTAKLQKDAQAIADRLSGVEVRITRQAGEGGKLFGSVSGRDIEEALGKQGVTINHKKMVVEQPIKHTGEYSIEVRLGQGLTGKIKVVVAEQAPAAS
jgi:large subunit ribosomal protein L9